jgi:CTP:molybdopterin cytidylyltransferase MocA
VIAGLLLAAGGARRFGSQKLVAELRGEPLVRHGARVLAAETDRVIAVVGWESALVRVALAGLEITAVDNADWALGLATSLRAGIAALPVECEAVVVMLGDQPDMDAAVIRAVIGQWRSTGKAIVSASYGGTRAHPVLFARSVFPELLALDGDAGARLLIERSPERVAYVEVSTPLPRDVDTGEDLRSLDA